MVVASKTPEGKPNHCPVCGGDFTLSLSHTFLNVPCPHCGSLVWFSPHHKKPVAIIDMSNINKMDEDWFTAEISVFILDFSNIGSNIEQLNSALLGKLITLCIKGGKRIKLVGLGPELIELFATTKLDKRFDIYDNPEDAFANLSAG